MPADITVALVGRRPFEIQVDALRTVGDLLELTADDLWFRSWEIERLFRDGYGQTLVPEEVDELRRLTEGWATPLNLFHRATAGCSAGDRARMLAGLAASPAVHDFLVRNVLADLGPSDLALLAEPPPAPGSPAAAGMERLAAVEGVAVAGNRGSAHPTCAGGCRSEPVAGWRRSRRRHRTGRHHGHRG